MLDSLVKDNIKGLLPYKVKEYTDIIKLDANENNSAAYLLNEKLCEAIMGLEINKYPDSDCTELRNMLAKELNLDARQIMVGCGSDQLISLIMSAFIGNGDKMLTHIPTFGIYKIAAQIEGGITVEVPLNEDFSFDLSSFVEAMEREKPKVIFLTNPNNPTGNVIPREQITKIVQLSKGIVVIDEAYYEFYGDSVIDLVDKYENLVVLRTLSKAYGLAGARVGYGAASGQLMDILYKVKPPYNVTSLSQVAAKVCLANKKVLHDTVKETIEERGKMINSLKEIPNLEVFESHANFVLCKLNDAKGVYDYLLNNRVLVRYFGEEGPLANCLRISIGTKDENAQVVGLLKKLMSS
ncbi:MAG: histidinol-phosphate transaminase [Candidatus Alkaliphilus sp. MAG34]|nr:histidinol-phosphate transaminase [Clostridiales bacterium]